MSLSKQETDFGESTATPAPPSVFHRMVDLFKPALREPSVSLDSPEARNASSPLNRSLKNRHLQMIAIGSSIGTGLFVGSGAALASGGPGAVIIAWVLTGLMIYCVCQALGELAVAYPVSGGFNTICIRFVDTSVGFAVAWNYFLQYATLMPLELVAASMTVQYWNDTINPDVWVAIFYVLVCSINFFGVKGYGEAEFVFSSIKVVAVIGFIILGIVIAAGGGPKGGYVGALYWHNPGAFSNGFKGVCSVFVTAAFSFAGTELVGLAGALESADPGRTLPKAIRQVFWRITLFYFVSLTLITFLVPYNDEQLLGASSTVEASPFVIAIERAGILVLPHIMNAVILILVLSVASSLVYAASRTLTGLAEMGQAPAICGYVDRMGRPMVAIMITNVLGLLAFLAASKNEADIFTWLMSISGLLSIFTWITVCWAHLRFRRAWRLKGHALSELRFVARSGTWGSIYGIVLNVLVLAAQFWVAVAPIGGGAGAEAFFESYLGGVVLVVCYVGHKIGWGDGWRLQKPARDIDIETGRRDYALEGVEVEIEPASKV